MGQWASGGDAPRSFVGVAVVSRFVGVLVREITVWSTAVQWRHHTTNTHINTHVRVISLQRDHRWLLYVLLNVLLTTLVAAIEHCSVCVCAGTK